MNNRPKELILSNRVQKIEKSVERIEKILLRMDIKLNEAVEILESYGVKG